MEQSDTLKGVNYLRRDDEEDTIRTHLSVRVVDLQQLLREQHAVEARVRTLETRQTVLAILCALSMLGGAGAKDIIMRLLAQL